MPYINDEDRRYYEHLVNTMIGWIKTEQKGHINYLACQLVITRLFKMITEGERVGYTQVSETIDALKDAADECKRRLLDPYEDKVCCNNGDVFAELRKVLGLED